MAISSDIFDTAQGCRKLYLQHLGALLRDSNLISGSAIVAIQEGVGAYFDEMIATDRRGSFADEAHGLTSSRITLVGEDDLELGIRLDRLGSSLFNAIGAVLWKIHLRFVTLLRRPGMPATDNPVGPVGISQGLQAMFAAAGASSLDQKMALLDRIEGWLRDNLPALYAEIDNYLAGLGVEPAQPSIVTSPEGAASQPVSGNAHAAGGEAGSVAVPANTLQALQQLLIERLPGGTQASTASGAPAEGAVAGLLNQAMLERLAARLDDLDRRGVFATPPAVGGPQPASGALMPELFPSQAAEAPAPRSLRASELGIPAEAREGVAIDTLAMIFEAIFNDPDLPDALKALISSLQITVLKVAMKDRSLFTDDRHVVRRVLDGMGRAVAGLPVDVPARHPVCARLATITATLRGEGSDSDDRFAAALVQLDELHRERAETLARFVEPGLPLFERLDRRDRAVRAARETVATLLADEPASSVRNFVSTTWRDYLQHIGETDGTDSPAWQEAIATIRDLLWTFLPKADAEGRKALAGRLPAILTRLKAGMAAAGLAAEAQQTFLDDCFTLQTLALRNQPRPSAPASELLSAEALTGTPTTVVAETLEAGGARLLTLDFGPHPVAFGRTLPCNVGDWLEMQTTEDKPQMLHVCRISPESRRLLLGNPESGAIVAAHPAIVERQFRDGKARNRSLESLFDRAAARALGESGAR